MHPIVVKRVLLKTTCQPHGAARGKTTGITKVSRIHQSRNIMNIHKNVVSIHPLDVEIFLCGLTDTIIPANVAKTPT